MNPKKLGAFVLAGLLYGQAALGLVAVGAFLIKQPQIMLSDDMGYGLSAAARDD